MKRISLTLLFCATLALVGCKNEKKEKDAEKVSETEKTQETTKEVKKVTVTLVPKSDSKLSGNVVFTEENGEVTMTAIIDCLLYTSDAADE